MEGKNRKQLIRYKCHTYIEFAGSPVELTDKNTRAVFGDYIDIYDMTRATEDGTTVKIFYESRIENLKLPEEMKPKVDSEYDEITEYQEIDQKEKLKRKPQLSLIMKK